ncbi:MAG: SAM-dependent chlorinase/fluorinase [Bacteroidales bacterium]|jgi:S-adenosylmethionine hydrolase|nr:SAM-dependent chlorinase/fluorinase [Bacteroidales bacterium]
MITVTLTTDWGTDGFYTGAFKGCLVARVPGVQLVDISHQIEPLRISQAAWALKNSYHYFLAKTIHIIAVGGKLSDENPVQHICFQYKGHYFIGPNNGVWEMIFNEEFPSIETYKLPQVLPKAHAHAENKFHAFPELGMYIDAIGRLAMGERPNHIGEKIEAVRGRKIGLAARMPDSLQGEIICFDVYGNAITNITKKDFDKVGLGRPFTIRVGSMRKETTTDKIAKNYYDGAKSGFIMALFSFSGYLEIALPNDNFKKYFSHVDKNTKLTVRFFNSEEEKEASLH